MIAIDPEQFATERCDDSLRILGGCRRPVPIGMPATTALGQDFNLLVAGDDIDVAAPASNTRFQINVTQSGFGDS